MASAVNTAEIAILSRVKAQLPTSTLIAWPNVSFTPPSPRKAWLQVSILWGETFSSTIGGTAARRNTLVGVIQLDIRVPKGSASSVANALVDQIRDAFNRVEFSGIRCDAPSAPVSGPFEDEWARSIVSIGFTADETL